MSRRRLSLSLAFTTDGAIMQSKDDLIKHLDKYDNPRDPNYDKLKTKILSQCSDDIVVAIGDLENSINKNATASDSLGRKVLWLNWLIGVATVVIAAATVAEYFKQCP